MEKCYHCSKDGVCVIDVIDIGIKQIAVCGECIEDYKKMRRMALIIGKCYHCGEAGTCEIERIDETDIIVCEICIDDYEECDLCERNGRLGDMEYLHLHTRTCNMCIGSRGY